MEEAKTGYFISTGCKACNAKDRAGNPLRDWMDNKKDEGVSTRQILEHVKKEGVSLTQPNLDRHFKLHSPWIHIKKREIERARASNIISRASLEHRMAEEEIQRLVDIGGDRVDSGEMKVDKDLYMFALDRKTKHAEPISIHNLVMNFGDALIESHKKDRKIFKGEIVTKDESS